MENEEKIKERKVYAVGKSDTHGGFFIKKIFKSRKSADKYLEEVKPLRIREYEWWDLQTYKLYS